MSDGAVFLLIMLLMLVIFGCLYLIMKWLNPPSAREVVKAIYREGKQIVREVDSE